MASVTVEAPTAPTFTGNSSIRPPPHKSIPTRYPTDTRSSMAAMGLSPPITRSARSITGADSAPITMQATPVSASTAVPVAVRQMAPGSSDSAVQPISRSIPR